eukprot:scaffold283118_cov32-Tisochrysis_lutea.AAC.4
MKFCYDRCNPSKPSLGWTLGPPSTCPSRPEHEVLCFRVRPRPPAAMERERGTRHPLPVLLL